MKNENKIKLVNYLLTFAVFAFIFVVGFKSGEYYSTSNINRLLKSNEKSTLNFKLFFDVWSNLEKKYVDKEKLNPQKMFYGAIKGMVSSLDDPYTYFLTPEENRQAKNDLSGKFEGIGAQLGLKEGRIIVISPLKNSPAEKAGVRAGDFINAVDGQKTTNWTLTQAVSKIRGPKSTKVKLTLERNNKEFDVVITRDQIIVASVELKFKNNLALVAVNQFGDNTEKEWDEVVFEVEKQWKNKKIKGMVLDLRDNPGGYLEGAVYLAGEFLKPETLVVRQESKIAPTLNYKVQREGKLLDIPLVVLINQGSASASEILAGSLRDNNRAKLVGEKSFGKGSVQEAIDLEKNAGLHVTVAKWILPKGDWINNKGLTPQIEVKNPVDEKNSLTEDKDKQLEKAMEILLK